MHLPSAVPSKSRTSLIATQAKVERSWQSRPHAGGAPHEVQPDAPQPAQKVFIELKDVYSRLPSNILRLEPYDPALKLWFRVGDIAALLSRGKATIPVSAVAQLCPEIFNDDVDFESETEILFPWHKAVEQVRQLKGKRSDDHPVEAAHDPAASEVEARSESPFVQESAGDAPHTGDESEPSPGDAAKDPPKPPAELPRGRQSGSGVSAAGGAGQQGDGENLNAPLSAEAEFNVSRDHLNLLNRRINELEQSHAEVIRQRDAMRTDLAASRKEWEQRVNELLGERDALASEKTKLAAELARALEAHKLFAESSAKTTQRLVAELTSSPGGDDHLTQLRQGIVELTRERDEILQEKSALSAQLARVADEQRFELDRLRQERDGLAREKEAAFSRLSQNADTREKELLSLARERDAAVKLKEATTHDLNRLRRQLDAMQAELTRLADSHAKAMETLRTERDQIAQSKQELAAQLARLLEDHRTQIAAIAGEREELNRAREELAAQLACTIDEHKKQFADVLAEREALVATSEEISAQLVQAKDTARKQLETLTQQFERTTEEHKSQVEGLLAERDRLVRECESVTAELEKTKLELTKQLEEAVLERDRSLQAKEALAEQFNRFKADSSRQIDQLSAQIRSSGDDILKQLESITKERDLAVQELAVERKQRAEAENTRGAASGNLEKKRSNKP